jgi:hypothetical protein
MKTQSSRLNKRRPLLLTGIILLIILSGIQFIRPEIKNAPVTEDLEAPPNVKAILERACYDCHSNSTNLRWYDKIAPAYWAVAEHINDGRRVLNFSTWNNLPLAAQKAKLWESVNQILTGAMPVKSYEFVHASAHISSADLEVLKSYVSSMIVHKVEDTALIHAADKQYMQWQKDETVKEKLPMAANGISYMPDYKNWQAVSTTERFDNGTMRVIFGNDIAIKAIRENHIHPWPDGTKFAKVAWWQLEDKDGNIKPGAFAQIEYMIKDSKKYASTLGWGFARFKTPKMVPYGGSDVMFTNECVNCHRPMKDEDFVFTLPIKY